MVEDAMTIEDNTIISGVRRNDHASRRAHAPHPEKSAQLTLPIDIFFVVGTKSMEIAQSASFFPVPEPMVRAALMRDQLG